MRSKRGSWRHFGKKTASSKTANPTAAFETSPVAVGPKILTATQPQSAWWLSRRLAHKARTNKAVRKIVVDKSTTRVGRKNNIRKAKVQPTKLRSSITPGTVLILLAGEFKGKRVVFLNQLKSGLLLVTGPFKVNGVPLRRVNQAYTIATSTKIDISGVDTSKVVDALFQKEQSKAKTGDFFDKEEKKAKTVSPERKALQKKVDDAVVKAVAQTPLLGKYLGARFSLSAHQYPHTMAF